jgi:hypothetical protein
MTFVERWCRAGTGPSRFLRRHWHAAFVLVATLVLIGLVVVEVVARTEWPVGGDLALHLVAIQWLRENGLHSWTFGWFGGMPLFYFYFPLPAAMGMTLSELMGIGWAMRVLVVIGPLTLPLAVMALAVAGGATRLEAAAAGVGAVVFLHLRSLSILGGTLEAAAIGEYSYSIALVLGLMYLAILWKRPSGPGRIVIASLLLASVALSHLIVLMIVTLASAAVMIRGSRVDAWLVFGSWGLGFLLSAFWTVPFLVRMPEMADIWWRSSGAGVTPLLAVQLLPLAIIVGLGATLVDRDRMVRFAPFAALGAAGLLPLVTPVPFLPARGLPFLLLALCVTACIALVHLGSAARAGQAPIRVATALVAALILLGVLAVWPVSRSPMYRLLRGTESAADRSEWEDMRRALAELSPGAFLWVRSPPAPRSGEGSFSMFRYTTEQLPILDGRRTLGGLLQESAPVSQYVREAQRNLSGFRPGLVQPFSDQEADFSLGLNQAAALGVRYLVLSGERTLSVARNHPRTHLRVDAGQWAIAELLDAPVVLAFEEIPTDPCRSERRCREWFSSSPEMRELALHQWPEGEIRLGDRDIRFETPWTGRPHLIRLSYFPGWRLESRGDGPVRFGPNQMLIVPESDHVVLRFTPGWPVLVGRLISVLGLVLGAALASARWSGSVRAYISRKSP